MAFFPMYIDLTDKNCLVIGGGNIALHKVKVLLDFDARVEVVAEKVSDELYSMEALSDGKLKIKCRTYQNEDCLEKTLVVSATDNTVLNHSVAEYCKKQGIPVNAVDQKEDCTFIFPSYVKEQNLVAAFSSGGNSPLLTQELKKAEKNILTPLLGEINECLGACREYVQEHIKDTKLRGITYREIYEESIQNNQVISEERIQELIEKYEL